MMFSLLLTARDIMINVKGRTLDNLTGENIGDVTLVLMNADSIPIDTMVSIGPPNHPMLVGMFAFKVGEVGEIHHPRVGCGVQGRVRQFPRQVEARVAG